MKRKKYDITTIDGNAFCIMGYVTTAMSQERTAMGWNTPEDFAEAKKAYLDDAQSAGYDHLVSISDAMLERINEAIGKGGEDA